MCLHKYLRVWAGPAALLFVLEVCVKPAAAFAQSSGAPDYDVPKPADSAGTRASGVQEGITSSRNNAITRAAALVGPSVVAVSVIQTRVVRAGAGPDDFWSRFFFPRYYRERVPSMGSGFIVSADGYILTNEHVTSDADSIWVTLSDGRTFAASLVGRDQASDLAVLKIDAGELPAASLGNSDSLVTGEWAIAVGNPFGFLLADTKPTVTVGVISATERDVKSSPDGERFYRKVIQTDAAINPGNSGGPLVNASGEVVGINSFIFSSSRGSEGIGFAIPINQARVVLADLIRYGEVRPAWIGVRLLPAAEVMGRSRGTAAARGVLVRGVQPGSPAAEAGLKADDVIVSAGGKPVNNIADWEGVASYWRPGQRVGITYSRGDRLATAQLALQPQPLLEAEAVSVGEGLWVTAVTAAVASQLALPDREGVVVVRVETGSAAETAGLERGDVILQVNNDEIGNPADLSKLIRRQQGYRRIIRLLRDGQFYLTSLD